jgi:tRNA (guanine37-N1)-methyltransferase
MLLRVDVVDQAIQKARCNSNSCNERVILLDAGGEKLTQPKVNTLATAYDHLILICAHYEGIDQRIREFIDEELSIGDYVLTGGELPAMIIVDSVVRLLPGVLGKDDSSVYESFQSKDKQTLGLLEYPQYTKPVEYNGLKVPEILVSGHHKRIAVWREEEGRKRTKKNRPDLLKR